MQCIEEVYKKEWIIRFFLMRQIFVFVELFAHGGSTSTLQLCSEHGDFLCPLSFSDNINHSCVTEAISCQVLPDRTLHRSHYLFPFL